ncbi:TPA: glycosyltransferase [Candidatus Poribacteria bacterium]|nr:glycosyltransferase [Candidatus Poribacteria bacterium]HEX30312.1 glycosyltransferase [Candidatus Poribacteria bacterium]
MRVLILSPFIPLPATEGGRIRVINLLKHLSPACHVTLLAPKTFNSTPRDEQIIRDMGVDLVVAGDMPHLSIGSIRSMADGYPIPLAKYRIKALAERFRRLIEEEKFDVVQFEMLHAGQYLPVLRRSPLNGDTPSILIQHNIDSIVWTRLYRNASSSLRKLGAFIQSLEFRRIERRLCPMFDLCVCMSERDAERLRWIAPDVRVEIVPNGVDLEYFQPREDEVRWNRIVYVGSMDWYPNEDAVLYFHEHIWPIIRREIPEAEFYIVGQYPSPRVKALDSVDGVHVTGLVDDIRPYVASAAVFIVPLRIGGGTRLKILEALAMGKAVVSSGIGCEGLDLTDGEDLIVADGPEEFAGWVIRLMRDEAERERLARSGRKKVVNHFGWDRMAEEMLRIYTDLA